MRNIDSIIIHCTDTMPLDSIDVDVVRNWHLERGFSDIGYHYLITLDGTVQFGRPVYRIGAHCKGHNRHSIGIAYVGGRDFSGCLCDTRTSLQRNSFVQLIRHLLLSFSEIRHIYGHCELDRNKICPCFDVSEYRKLIDIVNPTLFN